MGRTQPSTSATGTTSRKTAGRASAWCPAVATAALAALLITGAQAAIADGESWYDADHGWRLAQSAQWIEETNDGGLSWRRIYRTGGAAAVLRTGRHAGVYYESGCCAESTYWTNDGKAFYTSRQITPFVTGEGRFLFVWNGRNLYRVTPWPFPSKCLRQSRAGGCVYKAPGGRERVAAFTSRLVSSVPNGVIGEAATVPGGVVAVSAPRAGVGDAYAIVARWIGRDPNRPTISAQALPAPPNVRLWVCGTFRRVYVSWPDIVVPACAGDPAGPLVRAGYWQTSNGGTTWDYRGPT